MLHNLTNKVYASNAKTKEALNGYIFMSPTIIILGIFLVLPILFAIFLAFHKIQPLGEFTYNFRGWKNFIRMTNDERVGIWNNFLTPLIVLSDSEMFTLPLGLNTFKGQYISYWNYIMAASMTFTLPALAIYGFFNRYFIQGVTFTGSK